MKPIFITSAVLTVLLTGCSTIEKSIQSADTKTTTPLDTEQKTTENSTTELYPPNAKPGECYARVLTPAVYATQTEKILAKAASESINIVPAKYETVAEKVLVSESTIKIQVIPETYKAVAERILVEPAREVFTKVPAKYKEVTEKILVKPAYTMWKKGVNPINGAGTAFSQVKRHGDVVSKFDQSTGEIMCLVEVPAEYKTVTKQIIETPPTTIKKTIPAKYTTVTKKIVATPATTKKITIPAKYKTVKVRKLVAPVQTVKSVIPAQYKTVNKRIIVTQPILEWREILCETNTTPDLITRLQKTLNVKGYNAGRIDGVLGRDTLNAVVKYQRDNQLSSGQLTMATLKSLGVQ